MASAWDAATVFRLGRAVDTLSGVVGGDSEAEAAKVGADAVAGASGTVTSASPSSDASPSMDTSFVRMADNFLRSGAISSGTAS